MRLVWLLLGIIICVSVINDQGHSKLSVTFPDFLSVTAPALAQSPLPDNIPAPQTHPLPLPLAQWQTQPGDHYFDQVQPSPVGYLIWSQFPIQVYVEQGESDRDQEWREAVIEAVQDWQPYLPITFIETPDDADIRIFNQRPPLQRGELRARSAEARYEFYGRPSANGEVLLYHRFTIWISPTQTGKYIPAAARHEFGHALGIWGHSLAESDVMYFSQVREPPGISVRDINTLKQVYQQPTRLGWSFLSGGVTSD